MTFIKKKSLGQNFLRNAGALQKIVEAAEIKSGETVLEIGPGEGNLTGKLLDGGAKVVAVEKDDRLIPILQEKFTVEISSGQLTLIHDDILHVALFSAIAENRAPMDLGYMLHASGYKIVANIPYYITGEILRKALSEWPQLARIVLLVQKEVAERIVARNGKESLLSISVKIYGDPKIIGVVKAGSFAPAPKVDSAILLIENISKNRLAGINEQHFFEIVRAGFAHKRKILAGNLKPLWGADAEKRLAICNIPKNIRAENLTLENWLCLARHKSTNSHE